MILKKQDDRRMVRTIDKKFLAPLLQQHGFEKCGLTWNRSRMGVTQVVNIQVCKFNGPDRIDFTVNMGIWMQSVWSVYWNAQIPSFIEEDDCFPRFRIGDLLANFRHDAEDVWWSLHSVEDSENAGQELRRILSTNVLSYFNGLNTMLEVKDFCDSTELRLMPADRLYYAILNYLVGDRAGYERLVSEFADVKLRAWQPRVAEIAQRLKALARSVP